VFEKLERELQNMTEYGVICEIGYELSKVLLVLLNNNNKKKTLIEMDTESKNKQYHLSEPSGA
jgi:hypothetical protein